MPATKLAQKQIKVLKALTDTSIKTGAYAAVDGDRVLVNSTGGPISITLPVGVEGAKIAVQDIGGAAGTNNITVVGTINGSVNYVIADNFGNVELLFSDGDYIITSKEPSGGGPGGGPDLTIVSTKIANYTAAVNQDVPVNSTAGVFNITLPPTPAHGDRVRIPDVGGQVSVNPVTILRNGNNINGLASDVLHDVDYEALEFEFYTTFGWVLT